MDKKRNIKYILIWGLFLIFFMVLSFAINGIPENLGMYILIYLAIFILSSIILYFSDFSKVKQKDWQLIKEPTTDIRRDKVDIFFIIIFCLVAAVIIISILLKIRYLMYFGILTFWLLAFINLVYSIYRFFVKKEPLVPLGSLVYGRLGIKAVGKPFQYFYIVTIIIALIAMVIITAALFMDAFS